MDRAATNSSSSCSSRFRHSDDELDKTSLSHNSSYGESTFDANESRLSSHGTIKSTQPVSSLNADKFKASSSVSPSSSSSQQPQKKICVLEVFPWLNDIEKSTQKCLGSITEVKSKTILSAMDFLLR